MKTLRIALIGVAGRGTIFRTAHRPELGQEIVAGADTSLDALESFRKDLPQAQTFTGYRQMLRTVRPDAVFILTPDHLHEEMALAALDAGCAVYLEKPLAITIEGCDQLLERAWKTGSKLFIGHNMRYMDYILEMKKIIADGTIGEVQCGWCRHFINYGGDAYFRDWHSERRNTTGLLLQKGAHDIDVLHFLLGSRTRQVVGMGMLSVYDKCARRPSDQRPDAAWSEDHWPPDQVRDLSPVIDVEDHNMILMQLESGAQASYMQCHYTPDSGRNYTIIGTRGRLENVGNGIDQEIHVWTRRGVGMATPDMIHKMKRHNGEAHGGSDWAIIRSFLGFVRGEEEPEITPVAARDAVAVGVLAHDSMRNGSSARTIPPLRQELLDYFRNQQKR